MIVTQITDIQKWKQNYMLKILGGFIAKFNQVVTLPLLFKGRDGDGLRGFTGITTSLRSIVIPGGEPCKINLLPYSFHSYGFLFFSLPHSDKSDDST